MGGKGGDDSSFTGNAYANSGPVMDRMAGSMTPPPVTETAAPVEQPFVQTPVMPTQGDDAKTPGDNTATPGSGASDGSGTGTGDVAAQTLAAPSYWFNQPISTLAPKPIQKKGGSIKTTSGSV